MIHSNIIRYRNQFLDNFLAQTCFLCQANSQQAICSSCVADLPFMPTKVCPHCAKLVKNREICYECEQNPLPFNYSQAIFSYDYPIDILGGRTPLEAAQTPFMDSLAKKGILMRKFGQEIIKLTAGKRIHGIATTPGGVHKTITAKERKYFTDGKDIPSIDTMIEWSVEIIDFIKQYHSDNKEFLDTFAAYPSGHLGVVKKENGFLELYDGVLRATDYEGNTTLDDVPNDDYNEYFYESVEKWTYLKFPYLKHLGREKGWNRVGPLARLNVCEGIETPLAHKEWMEFMASTNGKTNNMTMHTHWARLIEILYSAEMMKELLEDDDLLSNDLIRKGERRKEGIGIIEAPRGTLIHHYEVDDKDRITRCNLIVSTTHNNEPMNQAVKWVANNVLDGKAKITEGMLNQVEVAIRAYDPCLSCATHAMGQMPLNMQLVDHYGNIIDERIRQ